MPFVLPGPSWPAFLLAGLIGYALGSIPFGVIVARVYRGVDLTSQGSGRTGATNVLRTLGPGAAFFAFAGDFVKGALAVVVASALTGGNPWGELVAALASMAGHTYSPFLGFKGGRGVVTGLAATVIAAPLLMLVAVLVGIAVIAVTRYVSLGSVVSASVGGLLMVANGVVTQEPAWAVWGILVAGFIDVAHRDNIQRLLAGTERKLGKNAGRA